MKWWRLAEVRSRLRAVSVFGATRVFRSKHKRFVTFRKSKTPFEWQARDTKHFSSGCQAQHFLHFAKVEMRGGIRNHFYQNLTNLNNVLKTNHF